MASEIVEIVVCVDEPSCSSMSEPRNDGESSADPQEEEVSRRNGDEAECSNSKSEIFEIEEEEEATVQCRICLEEGRESEMEAPCACSGTIKFAHSRCLQRWCEEKEGIICEICKKVYPLRYMPESRGCQERISGSMREDFLQPIDEESFAAACAALTLLILYLVHHVFMIMGDWGILHDVSGYFEATLLIAVLLLPCYAIARYCCKLRNRRRREHGA